MATQIDFYTQVAEPLDFACRLVGRLYRRGERLLVWLSAEQELAILSQRLWSGEETAFIPHCRLGAVEVADTPIWLTAVLPSELLHPILLNLGPALPEVPGRFARILEVVGQDEGSLAEARQRFRTYRLQGYTVEHHDMSHK